MVGSTSEICSWIDLYISVLTSWPFVCIKFTGYLVNFAYCLCPLNSNTLGIKTLSEKGQISSFVIIDSWPNMVSMIEKVRKQVVKITLSDVSEPSLDQTKF